VHPFQLFINGTKGGIGDTCHIKVEVAIQIVPIA
jgi:hypothetical protein